MISFIVLTNPVTATYPVLTGIPYVCNAKYEGLKLANYKQRRSCFSKIPLTFLSTADGLK